MPTLYRPRALLLIAAIPLFWIVQSAGRSAQLPADRLGEQAGAYVVGASVELVADTTERAPIITLVPGQIVVSVDPPPGAGWHNVVAAARGSRSKILGAGWTRGWILDGLLEPLVLPALGVAFDSSVPQVDSSVSQSERASCVNHYIVPGEKRYLRALSDNPFFGPTIVYVDHSCWRRIDDGSEDTFVIRWAAAATLTFLVKPNTTRACASKNDSLPGDAQRAVASRWPVLPTSCAVFEVHGAPDLFPGEHTVYQTGAFVPYELPEGFDEVALEPSLLVDGAVLPWNSVAPEIEFRPFDREIRVFRETESYTLVARMWYYEPPPIGRHHFDVHRNLEILRGSIDPFRLESVFHEDWNIDLPEDEMRPFVLHLDGTVEREGDRVCTYSESAGTYECRVSE